MSGRWSEASDCPQRQVGDADYVALDLGRTAARALVARARYRAGVIECPRPARIGDTSFRGAAAA